MTHADRVRRVPTYNEQEHLQRDAAFDRRADLRRTSSRSSSPTGARPIATRRIAASSPSVRVVDNPERIQAAGLNRALAVATRRRHRARRRTLRLADDYVERCVEALERTGAAMVGGGMTSDGPRRASAPITQRAIASAMASRLGAGPARFHVGGDRRLGRHRLPRRVPRARRSSSRWLRRRDGGERGRRVRDPHGAAAAASGSIPRIRSTYTPRSTFPSLARQFYRYGQGRAKTSLRHPRQVRPRQLVRPALVLGLVSRQASAGGGRLRVGRARPRRLRVHRGPGGCAGAGRRPPGHAPVVGRGLPASGS